MRRPCDFGAQLAGRPQTTTDRPALAVRAKFANGPLATAAAMIIISATVRPTGAGSMLALARAL